MTDKPKYENVAGEGRDGFNAVAPNEDAIREGLLKLVSVFDLHGSFAMQRVTQQHMTPTQLDMLHGLHNE